MTRALKRLSVGVVFVMVLALGLTLTHMALSVSTNQRNSLMADVAHDQAGVIESQLARSLATTEVLAEEVMRHDGHVKDFDGYADQLLEASGDGVANLQLAPDGVISHIYPLAGHEKAIGFNILAEDETREGGLRTIDQRKLTVDGPVELVQGGVGLLGRQAIFMDDENGRERFWGFATALILVDDLIADTELGQFDEADYAFVVSRHNAAEGVDDVIARSGEPVSGRTVTVSIDVPNADWTFTVSQPPGGFDWAFTLGVIASLLIAALAALITWYLLRQPEKLRAIVAQKTRELERLAFNDHLTGLANRRRMGDLMDERINEAAASGHGVAFLYVDLDDFKDINDTLGHEAGDLVLQRVAGRLQAAVRETDTVSRLGGDEFGILLLDARGESDVGRIAVKLIAAVEKPIDIRGAEVVVAASIGIAMRGPDEVHDPDILRHADDAMYAAKRAGKGAFAFYDPALIPVDTDPEVDRSVRG